MDRQCAQSSVNPNSKAYLKVGATYWEVGPGNQTLEAILFCDKKTLPITLKKFDIRCYQQTWYHKKWMWYVLVHVVWHFIAVVEGWEQILNGKFLVKLAWHFMVELTDNKLNVRLLNVLTFYYIPQHYKYENIVCIAILIWKIIPNDNLITELSIF